MIEKQAARLYNRIQLEKGHRVRNAVPDILEVSMVKLYNGGAYVLKGTEIVPDTAEVSAVLAGKMAQVLRRKRRRNRRLPTGS